MISPGKALIALNGLTLPIGAFTADYGDTHMFNPRWPGHAKFHNGQTLSMSIVLGLGTLYYTLVDVSAAGITPAARLKMQRQRLNFATLLAATYWITQFSAIYYPNSLCIDPEFGEGCPQFYLDVVYLSVTALGYLLERRRLDAHGLGKEV